MKKIALDGDFNFTEEQRTRLNAVGKVEILNSSSSDEEWLKAVQGYDVICTWGGHVLNNLGNLKNVLVTYPTPNLVALIQYHWQREMFLLPMLVGATESL